MHKLHIPNKLKCLQILCEGKVENLVDEFGGKEIWEYNSINKEKHQPQTPTTQT
jgi:hypothetical protein